MVLRFLRVAVLLSIASAAQVASAQSLLLNQYQGAPTPEDGFAVMRPVVPGHLRFSTRLHVDYANDPLVFEDVAGQAGSERTSVVRDQLTANVALSLGLSQAWLIYAGLPIDLLMKGDTLMGLPRASGTGLSDLYFGGRFQLFAPQGETGPLIALDAQLTLPTARAANEEQRFGGESRASGVIRGMVETSIATLRINLSAGLRFRPDTKIGGIHVRDELLFELSLMQPLLHEQLFAHLEVFGKSARDDFGRTATTPISALLGLRLRQGGLTFGLAGGAGVMRGYGAPDARVVFSAAITMPEREGIALPEQPAEDVEDVAVAGDATRPLGTDSVQPTAQDEPAATPRVAPRRQWVDSDGDGMRDDDDQCPRAPGEETQNGCPKGVRLDLDAHVIEVLDEIKFSRGGSAVLGRSFSTLEEVMAILKANTDMRLRIESHTHNEASSSASYTTTQARAGSIRDLLVEWGVDAERVSAFGCGYTRPVAPNDRSAGRKQNERIELHLVEANAADPAGCRAAP